MGNRTERQGVFPVRCLGPNNGYVDGGSNRVGQTRVYDNVRPVARLRYHCRKITVVSLINCSVNFVNPLLARIRIQPNQYEPLIGH